MPANPNPRKAKSGPQPPPFPGVDFRRLNTVLTSDTRPEALRLSQTQELLSRARELAPQAPLEAHDLGR